MVDPFTRFASRALGLERPVRPALTSYYAPPSPARGGMGGFEEIEEIGEIGEIEVERERTGDGSWARPLVASPRAPSPLARPDPTIAHRQVPGPTGDRGVGEVAPVAPPRTAGPQRERFDDPFAVTERMPARLSGDRPDIPAALRFDQDDDPVPVTSPIPVRSERGAIRLSPQPERAASTPDTPGISRPAANAVARVPGPLVARTATRESGRMARVPVPAETRPAVEVSIGRIDVRVVTAPPAVTKRPAAPAPGLSLDDYLRNRGGGAR